jgi:transposase InsO family protein
MPTELPLDALEMALWVRQQARHDVTGVIHRSDAGAGQYTTIRYAEVAAIASVGTVGDCLEWEVLSRRTFVDTETALAVVLDWCWDFYNHTRRHSSAALMCPINYETAALNREATQGALHGLG